MSEWMIETLGLTKIYGSGWRRKVEVSAVSDLDLKVGQGQILAFLGPNGAGKTTTAGLLMGFLKPTTGNIQVLGSCPGNREVRARIGYLPEHDSFYPFITAIELLNFSARLSRIPSIKRKERIAGLLDRLGLWEARNRRIGEYSKGMLRRLGLAQALLNDPELLILDEPTTGLDPVGRKEARSILQDLRNHGATVFLSSHILSEAELICDHVAIIQKGRLLRQGALCDVLGPPVTYEISFTDPSGAIINELRKSGIPIESDNERHTIMSRSEQHAQEVTEVVRAKGGILLSLVPKHQTLEEVFLKTIAASEASQNSSGDE